MAYLACGLLALQCGEDGPAIRSTRPSGTRTCLHAVGELYLQVLLDRAEEEVGFIWSYKFK